MSFLCRFKNIYGRGVLQGLCFWGLMSCVLCQDTLAIKPDQDPTTTASPPISPAIPAMSPAPSFVVEPLPDGRPLKAVFQTLDRQDKEFWTAYIRAQKGTLHTHARARETFLDLNAMLNPGMLSFADVLNAFDALQQDNNAGLSVAYITREDAPRPFSGEGDITSELTRATQNILIYVTVSEGASPDSRMTAHMGISKSAESFTPIALKKIELAEQLNFHRKFLNPESSKEIIQQTCGELTALKEQEEQDPEAVLTRGLSLILHGFAARTCLTHNPNLKFMVVNPVRVMGALLKGALPAESLRQVAEKEEILRIPGDASHEDIHIGEGGIDPWYARLRGVYRTTHGEETVAIDLSALASLWNPKAL